MQNEKSLISVDLWSAIKWNTMKIYCEMNVTEEGKNGNKRINKTSQQRVRFYRNGNKSFLMILLCEIICVCKIARHTLSEGVRPRAIDSARNQDKSGKLDRFVKPSNESILIFCFVLFLVIKKLWKK